MPKRPPPYDYRTLLSYRIVVLANMLAKGAARLYAGRFGLPLSEWRLLAALAIDAPAGAMHIAHSLGADKGWVSRTLAALARRGLIAVYVEHPEDGRRASIALTPAGRKLYRVILPAALERQRLLLAAFTPAEERIFRRLLDKMQRQAESVLDVLPRPAARARTPRRNRRTVSQNGI